MNSSASKGFDASLVEVALSYARFGLAVLPLVPRGKRPLVKGGFHSASRDENTIREWWTRWKEANVGVATGVVARLWVLDVDPRHGGHRSLRDLVERHGDLPPTPRVTTGGGGQHLYFRLPDSALSSIRSRAGVLPGLDVRADGGHVVAAGSVHESGQRYEWMPGAGIQEVPLADAPSWLLALVMAQPADARSTEHAGSTRFAEGTRNASLARMAGRMRHAGFDEEAIVSALLLQNQRSCHPPLTDVEVRGLCRSIARYPTGAQVGSHRDKDSGPSGSEPTSDLFRTAAELCSSSSGQVAWVARPWLVEGAITQLTGKPKVAGKTTFLLRLVAAILDGRDFLGERTVKGAVVYLSEERDATLKAALRRAGLTDRPDLHVLSWHRVISTPWPDVVRLGHERCKAVGAHVLVVDTISQFAQIRGDGENDSGTALEMLRPLQRAAADGIAVLIVHHDRKGAGDVGESARGSSALTGSADIVMSVRRLDGSGHDSCRAIHTLSRFGEVPEKLIIELTEAGGYLARGNDEATAVADAEDAIAAALKAASASALTLDELIENVALVRATCQRAVERLVESGRVVRAGAGRKGDPYRYANAFRPTKETSGWAEGNAVLQQEVVNP